MLHDCALSCRRRRTTEGSSSPRRPSSLRTVAAGGRGVRFRVAVRTEPALGRVLDLKSACGSRPRQRTAEPECRGVVRGQGVHHRTRVAYRLDLISRQFGRTLSATYYAELIAAAPAACVASQATRESSTSGISTCDACVDEPAFVVPDRVHACAAPGMTVARLRSPQSECRGRLSSWSITASSTVDSGVRSRSDRELSAAAPSTTRHWSNERVRCSVRRTSEDALCQRR